MIPPPADHGGDVLAVAHALGRDPDELLDLSVSLNPVAPDLGPLLREAVEHDALRRYPDPGPATRALAARLGVDPDQVLLTNGGAEAIALVAAHLGRVSIDGPEFSLWARHAAVAPGAPRVRSNPNNPTGLLADADDHAEVWDEAFYPLATGDWTRGDGLVVGSLTKLLACPGLRVGYVAGDVDVVETIRPRQPEWAVNGLACQVLPAALDLVDLAACCAAIAGLRTGLVALLARHGLTARPSDAPWVLVDEPLRDRLAPRGVVVRDCASFGLRGVTRIAVPDADGLATLDKALT